MVRRITTADAPTLDVRGGGPGSGPLLRTGPERGPCPEPPGSGQVAARRQVEAIPAETDLAVTVADVLRKHDGADGELSANAATAQDGRWPAGGGA